MGGFWILRKNKDRVWAIVKYENLSNFCFSYGKGCVEKAQQAAFSQETMCYGAHMRATTIKSLIRDNGERHEGFEIERGSGKHGNNKEGKDQRDGIGIVEHKGCDDGRRVGEKRNMIGSECEKS